MLSAILLPCIAVAIDGDTIKCGGVRYRLLAIDAADRLASPPCKAARPGFVCDDREAARATTSLQKLIKGRALTFERVTTDRYGRPVGVMRADGVNLSCAQLRAGRARYVVRYDNGRRVARECPAEAGGE